MRLSCSSPTFPPAPRPEPPSITHNNRAHPVLTEDASMPPCRRSLSSHHEPPISSLYVADCLKFSVNCGSDNDGEEVRRRREWGGAEELCRRTSSRLVSDNLLAGFLARVSYAVATYARRLVTDARRRSGEGRQRKIEMAKLTESCLVHGSGLGMCTEEA
ncbi:protein GAP-2 [Striga asiatica]|uniref:Protein GAP-2 n=1 Tax=Striga asiatica TaxID=4170 RepID=A0A5A7QBZ8_STRAF|nr:protein GAP-2 [Striga asiatica]